MTIFDNIEISNFPEAIQIGIAKANDRFSSGDIEGAITSLCGTIDDLTRSLYNKLNLQNYTSDNFVQHVAKCIKTYKSEFISKLKSNGVNEDDCIKIWDHHKRSLNGASEVMAAFRRNFSDAHGIKATSPELVQIALNSAYYVLKSFQITHPFIPPDHPFHKISDEKKKYLKNIIVKNIGINIILNYPNNINNEFKKIGLSKINMVELKRIGFLNQKYEITEMGIEILKVLAKE